MTEPSTAARKLALDILMRHPPCLRDDVPLNYLIDDIAASIDCASVSKPDTAKGARNLAQGVEKGGTLGTTRGTMTRAVYK